MGTSFLLDFERIDTALAGLVPRELVELRGEWSSKAQRRYESAGQLGSGTGPFVEVVDRRWRGTLVSPTAFTGMAFLATDTEVHWVKASHAALTLDVEVSLHAYADFSADRATFAARFGGCRPAERRRPGPAQLPTRLHRGAERHLDGAGDLPRPRGRGGVLRPAPAADRGAVRQESALASARSDREPTTAGSPRAVDAPAHGLVPSRNQEDSPTMPLMTLAELKDIVTLAGVAIAATSLVFAAVNLRATLRTNRARFWLDLRDRFARHDEVHRQLRPGGAWAGGQGPETAEDWARLEAYMGLFEHCEVMLDQGLIDARTFREIYAYRLRNLVANDAVRREKLRRHAAGWVRFLALLERMAIELPRDPEVD